MDRAASFFKRFLIPSLIFHSILFLLVLLGIWYVRTQNHPIEIAVPRTSFGIVLVPPEPQQTLPRIKRVNVPKAQPVPSENKPAPQAPAPTLNQLKPNWVSGDLQSGRRETTDTDTVAKPVADAYDIARLMTPAQETLIQPFVQAIWRKINSSLSYPDDLVKQGVRGNIVVHFVVTPQGKITDRFIKVTADDKILKAYVLSILIHALHEPLEQKSWLNQNSNLILAARFEFSTSAMTGIPEDSKVGDAAQFKNQLLFKRRAFRNVLNEKIERLFTHYIPPIIIVPPGILFINFQYAYEYFSTIGEIDPKIRREQRVENMEKTWEQIIQKKESETPKNDQ